MKRWIVYDVSEIDPFVHVVPENDDLPHTVEGTGCDCVPILKTEEGGMILVHNAYDGREIAERAHEIFKDPDKYLK